MFANTEASAALPWRLPHCRTVAAGAATAMLLLLLLLPESSAVE
jgi:hypothetical protein